ncbi:MAG TPA: TetR/AcrR family transcriptional regulator [Wenzhouxiangellaceae bacterium]|nr:TetR/AcrR family transcriptional regulator [Wenzhouxiangellaceae bacterium]
MSRSRTPERIAETALQLFNSYGEPNVTTNRISDELEISPGNLHYHFKTKQSLIDELFGRYEQRMLELLGGDGIEHADVEDAWLFLHLVFENIADYRFIYRDLNELCTRSRDLRARIRAILKLSLRTASDLLSGMERSGQLEAQPLERESVVRNIVLISSYWIAFDQVMEPEVEPRPDRAAIQVMSLVSPYLRGPAREQFEHLANAYR